MSPTDDESPAANRQPPAAMEHDDLTVAMQGAIREVRREGYKVAVIYGVVDAVVVALAANLLVGVLEIRELAEPVALPTAIAAETGIVVVTTGTAAAAGLGVAVLLAEVTWRIRRPIVERFEAANPTVNEALRTARDALAADRNTPMARALYADVIERLGSTSSLGLISVPRLMITVALVVGQSLASIQVSVAAIEVSPATITGGGSTGGGAGGGAGAGGPGGAPGRTPAPGGLGSSDDILGDPEDVSAGTENLSAAVPTGRGTGEDRARSYDSGGFDTGSSAVEAQRAGFEADENVENADLIKRYNLQIREEDRE